MRHLLHIPRDETVRRQKIVQQHQAHFEILHTHVQIKKAVAAALEDL